MANDKPVKKKLTFETTINGEKVKLDVRKPNLKQKQEGLMVYAQTMRECMERNVLLSSQVGDVMVKKGLWSEEKAKKEKEIIDKLIKGERRLDEGGFKLSEAKALALEMQSLRNDLRVLTADRTQFTSVTAEGMADNAQFNYWVSTCTVYTDSGKPVFSSLDDYMAKSDEEHALKSAANLAFLLHDLDPDFEKEFPENKFLLEHKFVDDKLYTLNKSGKRVDSEGRLIDEKGYYVNEKGERVDRDGNRLTEDGKYLVEKKPFIDDVYADEKATEEKTVAEPVVV